ncbi:hypothetical protein MADA3029_300048 [Vibrio nigripulchritudo MADA3029]|nr:hypothetical protein VIBNIMADA3020_840045 [Vibrio nigripulchritudo MADA3020]CCN54372.1 hypothetical protein VIBNIMADA3021_540046 [Vibrio nigripulchritudo MADA3021]CCN58972.1 hypothetical protein MADA3029_300048 [Vibrio nigripulchritudo MADA3029]
MTLSKTNNFSSDDRKYLSKKRRDFRKKKGQITGIYLTLEMNFI